MAIEMRDSKGKLKGTWDKDTNTVTIRDYVGKEKCDISFTLKPDGTMELKEIKVNKAA